MQIAAKEGSTNSIVAIAQKAPEAVSAEDDEGNQPLSQCYVGETVDMLTKLGADPRHNNEEGRTALHTTGIQVIADNSWYVIVKTGNIDP